MVHLLSDEYRKNVPICEINLVSNSQYLVRLIDDKIWFIQDWIKYHNFISSDCFSQSLMMDIEKEQSYENLYIRNRDQSLMKMSILTQMLGYHSKQVVCNFINNAPKITESVG